MKLYPMKLKGVSKSTIWGGRILIDKYNKEASGENIGESWELTCRKDEQSIVENGIFKGKTIGETIEVLGNDVISKIYSYDTFPLLIKLLNSKTSLSVQVHPDDAYAGAVENALGKTEMWYIMEADDDSSLVMGVKNYNKEIFQNAANKGELEEFLISRKISAGDCFFIPAGLVHAIGENILLCEIQQNSDITYRVYDYNRKDKNGNTRELHVDKAINVIREYTDEEIKEAAFNCSPTPVSENAEILAASDKFCTEKVICDGKTRLISTDESFLSLVCVKGNAVIEYNGEEYSFDIGDTYFIPAGMGYFNIKGCAEVLCASVKK